MSNNGNKAGLSSYYVAVTAALLAMVVLLQGVLGSIKIGAVSISFTLVPIVLGATVVGVKEGAFLGFAFGVITLVMGIVGADMFTNVLFSAHPVLTSLTCLIKGTAAGAAAGLVYKPFKVKRQLAGEFLAAFVAPTVNTALFIVGALTMYDTIAEIGGANVMYFLFIGCAGVNYLLETAFNLACVPALVRVMEAVKKR